MTMTTKLIASKLWSSSSVMVKRKQRISAVILVIAVSALLIAAEQSFSAVQKIRRFVSVLHDVLSEFRPTVSRSVEDVKLILWTRKSPLKYYELKPGDVAGLSISNYNRSMHTKILIHGFADMGTTGWVKTFKKHYLDRDDYNVISVDWEELAKSPWYTTAAKNSK